MKRALSLLLLLSCTIACGSKEPQAPVGISDKPGATAPTTPVTYTFDSLDERPVSSDAMRGKPTVLVFVVTGDILGQAQVDFLVAMAKNDGTKVNYAIVAVHPRREIVLVDTYVQTLKVTFPVALADASATGAGGPFGDIPAVPTLVVLDPEGKIVWKHTGLAKPEEIRAHMPR